VSLSRDPSLVSGHIALAGILLLVAINILSGFTNVIIAREKGLIPALVLSSSSMIIGGGALLSWILLPGEKPQLFTLLGMLVIAVSLILLNVVQGKKHAIVKEKT